MLKRLTKQFTEPRLLDTLLGFKILENYILYHLSQACPDWRSMKDKCILGF